MLIIFSSTVNHPFLGSPILRNAHVYPPTSCLTIIGHLYEGTNVKSMIFISSVGCPERDHSCSAADTPSSTATPEII